MKSTEIIKNIVKIKNITQTELAFRLGIERRVLYERLTQSNISVNKMDEMLKILGYKIVVMPYNVKPKEDWYEVTTDTTNTTNTTNAANTPNVN